MKKLYTLVLTNCFFLITFCQVSHEGDVYTFRSKENGDTYKVAIIENNPLQNNPVLHLHVLPFIPSFSYQPTLMMGAGADIYLLKALQINADFKVAVVDADKLTSDAAHPTYLNMDASAGLSYGFAVNLPHTERIHLNTSREGYRSVREYGLAEGINSGFHFGLRAGYAIHRGTSYYANVANPEGYGNINTSSHCAYVGIYLTRLKDLFIKIDRDPIKGRFGAQKVYADVLLPFINTGEIYQSGVVTVGKQQGFHPGFRLGMAWLPPYVKIRKSGKMSIVAFYMNAETGWHPGSSLTQTLPLYGTIGFGISYMTFKPHFSEVHEENKVIEKKSGH